MAVNSAYQWLRGRYEFQDYFRENLPLYKNYISFINVELQEEMNENESAVVQSMKKIFLDTRVFSSLRLDKLVSKFPNLGKDGVVDAVAQFIVCNSSIDSIDFDTFWGRAER